eukprot:comp11756_c0_seq1/m.6347 comp11756_c0_seq1/g.6347  ORF comp11756_c0_seq1/g.6347 comp11756_c0_seq1/m.6347 type:complete len:386 (+) comp11756_c0_seq1:476-1633(+)
MRIMIGRDGGLQIVSAGGDIEHIDPIKPRGGARNLPIIQGENSNRNTGKTRFIGRDRGVVVHIAEYEPCHGADSPRESGRYLLQRLRSGFVERGALRRGAIRRNKPESQIANRAHNRHVDVQLGVRIGIDPRIGIDDRLQIGTGGLDRNRVVSDWNVLDPPRAIGLRGGACHLLIGQCVREENHGPPGGFIAEIESPVVVLVGEDEAVERTTGAGVFSHTDVSLEDESKLAATAVRSNRIDARGTLWAQIRVEFALIHVHEFKVDVVDLLGKRQLDFNSGCLAGKFHEVGLLKLVAGNNGKRLHNVLARSQLCESIVPACTAKHSESFLPVSVLHDYCCVCMSFSLVGKTVSVQILPNCTGDGTSEVGVVELEHEGRVCDWLSKG